MNGLKSLKAIKQVPRPPLVIMLTNLGGEAYRAACLETGADFFFDKSYECMNVKDLVAAHGVDGIVLDRHMRVMGGRAMLDKLWCVGRIDSTTTGEGRCTRFSEQAIFLSALQK